MNKLLKILVFALLTNVVSAQKHQVITGYGFQWTRGIFDSSLQIPTGNGTPSGTASLKSVVKTKSALFYDSTGKKLWVFSPKDSTWYQANGSSNLPWDSITGKPVNFSTTYALSNDVKDSTLARLRLIDTSGMLSPYRRTSTLIQQSEVNGLGSALSGKLNLVDTASMLSGYARSGNIVEWSDVNVNNGVAGLDAGGKVPFSLLPASLMIYKGTWNALTNTPTLSDGTGVTGWIYIVSTGGTVNTGSGAVTYSAGDYAIYNGTKWERSVGTNNVASVNGQQGVVTLTTTNIGEGTNLYYTDTRSRAALSVTAGSGGYNPSTGVITIPTNNNQLTNGANYIDGTGVANRVPFFTDANTLTTNAGVYFQPWDGQFVSQGFYATGNIGAAGNITAATALISTAQAGTGNRIAYLNSGGSIIRGTIDPADIATTSGLAGKLNISDTAAMLTYYLRNRTGLSDSYAIGNGSMLNATSGTRNIGLGSFSLQNNTDGGNNVAIGYEALKNGSSISNNTAIGYAAGSAAIPTDVENSVYLGYNSTPQAFSSVTNEIVIGASTTGNGSNTVTIGNSSITNNYFTGNVRGGAFIKSGGTSSQFLKADGSVDGNTYATTSALSGYLPLTGGTLTGGLNGTTASFSASGATPILSLKNTSASTYATMTIGGTDRGGEIDFYDGSTPLAYILSTTAANKDLRFFTNGGATEALTISSTGAATFSSLGTGTVYSNSGTLTNTDPSDSTIKNTINPHKYGLAEILKLQPKSFYYNSDSAKSNLKYGFIAQEVEKIMPDMVRKINPSDSTSKLGLESNGIYVTLVNAIKEQQAQIELLKAQLEALKPKQ